MRKFVEIIVLVKTSTILINCFQSYSKSTISHKTHQGTHVFLSTF